MPQHAICSIYSSETGFDRIRNIIEAIFPHGKLALQEHGNGSSTITVQLKNGLFSAAKEFRISYRQRPALSSDLTNDDNDPLSLSLRGMYNAVLSLPAANEQVKELLLHKIRTLNSECAVVVAKGDIQDLPLLIMTITGNMDAVVFAMPGTAISKADDQHFLDSELSLIIDMQGNCGTNDLAMQMGGYPEDEFTELTPDQQERKARSEAIVQQLGVKINVNLPCIEREADTTIRTPTEIAQRLVILYAVVAVAFDVTEAKEAMELLQRHHLWVLVTPNEKEFFAAPDQRKKLKYSWQMECIWVLLWAVGKVYDLRSPAETAELDNIDDKDMPMPTSDPDTFINSITTARTKAEILEASDLYYRLNWACVDAHLNNIEMQAVHPGAVYERQYALNWLTNYMDQEWDDITCDT